MPHFDPFSMFVFFNVYCLLFAGGLLATWWHNRQERSLLFAGIAPLSSSVGCLLVVIAPALPAALFLSVLALGNTLTFGAYLLMLRAIDQLEERSSCRLCPFLVCLLLFVLLAFSPWSVDVVSRIRVIVLFGTVAHVIIAWRFWRTSLHARRRVACGGAFIAFVGGGFGFLRLLDPALQMVAHGQTMGSLQVLLTFLGGAVDSLMLFQFLLLNSLRLQDRLLVLANVDGLTGLDNRRAFRELFAAAIREKGEWALLLLDLDHFKQINDRYGHQGGDAVLIRFAEVCRQSLRASDRPARYGGEEFAIFLPETGREEARMIAERLRNAALAHPVTFGDQLITFSVSIGLRCGPGETLVSPDHVIGEADRALYQAKHAGRNCIVEVSEEGDLVPAFASS